MLINKETCSDCGICISICPVGAIKADSDGCVNIDLDECVECYSCKRLECCPTDSIYQQEIIYPRTVRSGMSNVLTISKENLNSGRGTEEMKTNEVTNRIKRGWVGVIIELGRPGIATRISDMEKVAMAVAQEDVIFEKDNPVTSMMSDLTAGKFKEELLNERVLSGIIELIVPLEKVPNVLRRLKAVASELDTVFSLGLGSKADPDGTLPHVKLAREMGYWISPYGKHNFGLGKPLAKEE